MLDQYLRSEADTPRGGGWTTCEKATYRAAEGSAGGAKLFAEEMDATLEATKTEAAGVAATALLPTPV